MNAAPRWWAIDLAAVVLLADLAAVAIYVGAPAVVRLPLALLLILVLPGYALVAACFPARTPSGVEPATLEDEHGGLLDPLPADYELGDVERLALSVVTSVAIVPSVAAVANFTPAGISLEPVLGGVVGVTIVLALVAFVRRFRLPPDRRYGRSPGVVLGLPKPFRSPSRLDPSGGRVGTYNLLAGVGLVLLASSVAFALVVPPTHAAFTEFYVVTGDATGATGTPYRTTFAAGRTQPVTLGIKNHEHRTVDYTVVAATQAPGPDGGGSGALTVVGRASATVADGATRQLDVPVKPSRTGDGQRLVFLLYEGDPPARPTTATAYRVLNLSVDVTGGATPAASTP